MSRHNVFPGPGSNVQSQRSRCSLNALVCSFNSSNTLVLCTIDWFQDGRAWMTGCSNFLSQQSHRRFIVVSQSPVCTDTTPACFDTCGRGAGTHGDVLNLHTEVFSACHTTHHTPPHGDRDRETDTERDKEKQREREKRQDKTRKEKTRQEKGKRDKKRGDETRKEKKREDGREETEKERQRRSEMKEETR